MAALYLKLSGHMYDDRAGVILGLTIDKSPSQHAVAAAEAAIKSPSPRVHHSVNFNNC
jgi:hypothetical protein